MEKALMQKFIKDIDKVVNSKSSEISSKDLVILVTIREGLKNAKSKKSYKKYIDMLLRLIGIASSISDKVNL